MITFCNCKSSSISPAIYTNLFLGIPNFFLNKNITIFLHINLFPDNVLPFDQTTASRVVPS